MKINSTREETMKQKMKIVQDLKKRRIKDSIRNILQLMKVIQRLRSLKVIDLTQVILKVIDLATIQIVHHLSAKKLKWEKVRKRQAAVFPNNTKSNQNLTIERSQTKRTLKKI